jgi:hypothetical protein
MLLASFLERGSVTNRLSEHGYLVASRVCRKIRFASLHYFLPDSAAVLLVYIPSTRSSNWISQECNGKTFFFASTPYVAQSLLRIKATNYRSVNSTVLSLSSSTLEPSSWEKFVYASYIGKKLNLLSTFTLKADPLCKALFTAIRNKALIYPMRTSEWKTVSCISG